MTVSTIISLIAGRERNRGFTAGIVLLVCVAASACGPNESVLKSGKETPSTILATPVPDTFERDLAAMSEVDFTWVYVFRRKDGRELDSDDKALIRTNAADTNRRVVSDGGKAVIVGTNYMISEANLKALKDRFDFTDLSPVQQNSPTPASKQ